MDQYIQNLCVLQRNKISVNITNRSSVSLPQAGWNRKSLVSWAILARSEFFASLDSEAVPSTALLCQILEVLAVNTGLEARVRRQSVGARYRLLDQRLRRLIRRIVAGHISTSNSSLGHPHYPGDPAQSSNDPPDESFFSLFPQFFTSFFFLEACDFAHTEGF